MQHTVISLGDCRFEILSRDGEFLGLGKVWIDETLVRSGRLPLRPFTQSFSGLELASLRLLEVKEQPGELRIETEAQFRPMDVKMMRDHSLDPIYETGDWDVPRVAGTGRLTLVLQPAADEYDGQQFTGFAYHYEYTGDVPLFFVLDKASWELDGDIAGATAISQTAFSPPVATFAPETAWSTEGILFFLVEQGNANPVMTHNLPRWAGHQGFDFQFKDDCTLIGQFAEIGLIRTVVCREAGKPELKCLDKHIFDQATECRTTPKQILLNRAKRTAVGQQNLWTHIMDADSERARAAAGLYEEPFIFSLHWPYWGLRHFDEMRRDLLPAAASLGMKAIYALNVCKSAHSERSHIGNLCANHEFEVAPSLGGPEALKRYIEDSRALGIRHIAWNNTDQALTSPLNRSERDEERHWYVKMEDARTKWGGAYMSIMDAMNLKNPEARGYWVESLKKIKDQTGLDCYLFDSFFNLMFMPVDFTNCIPATQWRELLGALKELQDYGIGFHAESFGPFCRANCGCHQGYNVLNMFACYKVNLGDGSTVIPSGPSQVPGNIFDPAVYYYVVAHKTDPGHSLFYNGRRIDQVFTDGHRQALRDYHTCEPLMHTRYLQEDGAAVLWHDKDGKTAVLWNFLDRELPLPGRVRDVTAGVALPVADRYALQAQYTYIIEAAVLPTEVGVTESQAR